MKEPRELEITRKAVQDWYSLVNGGLDESVFLDRYEFLIGKALNFYMDTLEKKTIIVNLDEPSKRGEIMDILV